MQRVDELESEAERRHQERKRELAAQARELGGLDAIEKRAPQFVRYMPPTSTIEKPDYCSCAKGPGERGALGGFHVRVDPLHGVELVIGRCPLYAEAVQRNAATPKQQAKQRQRELLED